MLKYHIKKKLQLETSPFDTPLFLCLSLKKSKTKMPSLVKKWQSIQKELEEEEKDSSSDEDRDQLNKKNIEEWKQQQLVT